MNILWFFCFFLGLVVFSTGKSATATGSTTECPRLLGMSSGSIQDWQIASSSQWTGVGDLVEFGSSSSSSTGGSGSSINGGGNAFNSQGGSCQPKYARLYQSGNKAWCAKHRSVGEWILVDLGVISQVWKKKKHFILEKPLFLFELFHLIRLLGRKQIVWNGITQLLRNLISVLDSNFTQNNDPPFKLISMAGHGTDDAR